VRIALAVSRSAITERSRASSSSWPGRSIRA